MRINGNVYLAQRVAYSHGDTKVASVWHEWPGPGAGT